MIKRVVDKSGNTVKKYPEYDSDKIYVADYTDGVNQFVREGDVFKRVVLGNGYVDRTYNSFTDVIDVVDEAGRVIYILDDQDDLASFIDGDRAFPKVKITEEYTKLAEDEVSVEDVNEYKIYAYFHGSAECIHKLLEIHRGSGGYQFTGLQNVVSYTSESSSIKASLRNAISFLGHTVYQFDTQEEFLRWSLEQVTGKKFIKFDLYEVLQ